MDLDLFEQIAEKSLPRLNDFTKQGLSDLLWSFTLLSVQHEVLQTATETSINDSQKGLRPGVRPGACYCGGRLVEAAAGECNGGCAKW